jgi:hypothetical protein
MRWWWGPGPLCTGTTPLVGYFYSGSSLKQQFPRIDMSPHSDTLSWLRARQSWLFCLNVPCLAENTYVILYVLTWSVVEPTIYHTRGEHANHCTTVRLYHQPYLSQIKTKGSNSSKIVLEVYSHFIWDLALGRTFLIRTTQSIAICSQRTWSTILQTARLCNG